jgi:hypothetical protein
MICFLLELLLLLRVLVLGFEWVVIKILLGVWCERFVMDFRFVYVPQ